MAQTNAGKSKEYKSFWPLTIILAVAILFAFLIYIFQFNFSVESDVNSMQVTVHRRQVPNPFNKTPVKKPVTKS